MGLGWNDLTTQVYSYGGSNGPSWTRFRDGIYLYTFPHNSPRSIMASFHVGHDYLMRSNLYPHFHFSVNGVNNSGIVRVGFEYTLAKGHQQALNSIFSDTITVYTHTKIDCTKDRYKHFTTETSEKDSIPGHLVEPDTVVLMRIFRDANNPLDTYTGDIFGITADIHYETGQLATPSRRPDFFIKYEPTIIT